MLFRGVEFPCFSFGDHQLVAKPRIRIQPTNQAIKRPANQPKKNLQQLDFVFGNFIFISSSTSWKVGRFGGIKTRTLPRSFLLFYFPYSLKEKNREKEREREREAKSTTTLFSVRTQQKRRIEKKGKKHFLQK